MEEKIKAEIAALEEQKKLLEINLHRIEAGIIAYSRVLEMMEPKSTEIKAEERPAGNN